MAIKDILLSLTGYPEPTPEGSIERAVAFAQALGARVSALAFEIEIQPRVKSPIVKRLLDLPAKTAEEQAISSENISSVLAAFEGAASRAGVFREKYLERCAASMVSEILVDHARLHDLTMIAAREPDSIEQWYAEAVIFGSGRPALILPSLPAEAHAPSLETVAVAWDFSRTAARALADALPLLQRARRVCAVTVINEKAIQTSRSGADLTGHLARHKVEATIDEIDAAGRPVGEVLKSFVASQNAGLLVMGAYGHSRMREFVLGGATRSMLAAPPVPVFFSH